MFRCCFVIIGIICLLGKKFFRRLNDSLCWDYDFEILRCDRSFLFFIMILLVKFCLFDCNILFKFKNGKF